MAFDVLMSREQTTAHATCHRNTVDDARTAFTHLR